ncbi:hypothetical protein [Streptomyces sp. NPDC007206]|uniref:hypothetical protein n=1 Tax=Streptomyces sp. NPDC007206 TaxID=3154317 RepID=UPI0033C43D86
MQVAFVVGDVRLEDGPQLLRVGVAQGDLVQQPVGRRAQGRDIGGQVPGGAPVLDELGAGPKGVLHPVEEFARALPGADHQRLGVLVQIAGHGKAAGARTEAGGNPERSRRWHVQAAAAAIHPSSSPWSASVLRR